MAYISVIRENEARDDLAELYQHMRQAGKWSDVPEGQAALTVMDAVFCHRSTALRSFKEWEKVVRFGDSSLSRIQREMIATVVSAINGCIFCTVAHSKYLRKLTKDKQLCKDLVGGYQSARLDEADRAMVDYAVKLGKAPGECGQQDILTLRANGFSDAAITDIALNVSLMSAINRMLVGLGMEVSRYHINEAKRLGMPTAISMAQSNQNRGTGGAEE
ncbi:peroxidase-related enzyme [bacterium]|nr:peroxidase-related enzyme [bacterium]